MRYREPYVTEGLNKKHAVNTPAGTYRGLRLGTHASALTVTAQQHPSFLDHVAVYQTGGGASLTIRKNGNFSIDLTALANKTVVLAIYATYGVGFTTTAEVRAYEFFPVDEFTGAAENAELVVLGTVVVPAAGLIPAANITHDRRRFSWEAAAPEVTEWLPLLKNPSFESYGYVPSSLSVDDVAWFWEATITAGTATWDVSGGSARSGQERMMLSRSAVGVVTGRLVQYIGVPIVPGQLLRLQLYLRALIASTAGSLRFVIKLWDDDRTASEEFLLTIPTSPIDAGYRKAEWTFTVPATVGGGGPALFLEFVGIESNVLDFGASTGELIRFDDFQAWLERSGPLAPNTLSERALQVLSGRKILLHASDSEYAERSALLSLNGATNIVEFGHPQPAAAPPGWSTRGQTRLGESLLGTEADGLLARVTAPIRPNAGEFTLMWESGSTLTGYKTRHYGFGNGAWFLTVNAYFDGTNWNKDVAGGSASPALRVGYNGITVARTTQSIRVSDTAWSDGSWLDFVTFDGPDLPTVANPRFGPMVAVKDGGGNRKSVVDHNGYPMGRRQVYEENWISASAPSAWGSFFLNGSVNFDVPGGGIRLVSTPSLIGYAGIDTIRTDLVNLSDSVHVAVMEWEYSPTNVNVITDCSAVTGWFYTTGFGAGIADLGLWIGKRSTDTNWQLAGFQYTGGPVDYWVQALATGTIVDTGITYGSSRQRMRLESHGSSAPGGRRALAYINGSLVAEITTAGSLPISDMGIGMEIVRPAATAGARSYSHSTIRCVSNRHFLGEDIL
jgi:hypothetical protein